MNTRILALLCATVLVAACAAPSGSGYYPSRTTSPQPSADYAGGNYAGHQPGVAESSSPDGTYTPRPEERPGLGTVYGENVTSYVDMKPFVRAANAPFAAVALYYNDAEGVQAHSEYVSGYSPAPIRAYTPNGGISISLTDQYGNILPGGISAGRTLIVGSEGDRYNIVLQNDTGGRYEVVLSVDGLDVIDGNPADLQKRGYILEPYSQVTVDGFRTSSSTVAAFRFGRVSESYAARTSGDRNVGVVGVGFFAEQGSVWTSDELHRRDTADPFPGDHAYAQPPPGY